jgi:hypothetical protein
MFRRKPEWRRDLNRPRCVFAMPRDETPVCICDAFYAYNLGLPNQSPVTVQAPS